MALDHRLAASLTGPGKQLRKEPATEQQRRGGDIAVARHDERRIRAARRRDDSGEHLLRDQHHVREHHDCGTDLGIQPLESPVQRAAGGTGESRIHHEFARETGQLGLGSGRLVTQHDDHG